MYNPYKIEAFLRLIHKAFDYGWYPGSVDLLQVRMVGAFEGFSGRASETWEHRFYVTFRIPAGDNKETHPERVYSAYGDTLDEASSKVLEQIEKPKDEPTNE